MKNNFYYLIVPESAAGRLRNLLAGQPKLESVAAQLKDQLPRQNMHTKNFWNQQTKPELVEQVMLYEKLLNYASNRIARILKEGTYEKENSKT